MFDSSKEECIICGAAATYGDLLFLDWGQRDARIDTFLITACDDASHRADLREDVVKVFQRKKGSARNAFVGGGIFHVLPLDNRQPEGPHRIIIWSDCKDFRAWDSARRI